MSDDFAKISVRGSTFSYKVAHFHQHKDVIEYLQVALERVISEIRLLPVGETVKKTVDLHKNLGKTHCIELKGDEEIFYAQKKGRQTLSKFVRGKQSIDCSCITFVIYKATNKRYKVWTAYIGYMAEREPLDRRVSNEEEFNRCKEFWDKHALVEGSQNIFADSITTECPWDTYQNFRLLRKGKSNIQDNPNKFDEVF
jgi:hypothetical protein